MGAVIQLPLHKSQVRVEQGDGEWLVRFVPSVAGAPTVASFNGQGDAIGWAMLAAAHYGCRLRVPSIGGG